MPGFNKDVCDMLKKPLTAHQRRGPGGNYSYFKGSDVVSRLNEAFQHGWTSEKLEEKIIEDQVLMLVSITVMNKEGDTVSHQGYGSAEIARSRDKKIINIGNTYKSAFTTALKKAAEQFGIGLGEEEEDILPSSGGTNSGGSARPRSNTPTPMPSRAPMQAPTPMNGGNRSMTGNGRPAMSPTPRPMSGSPNNSDAISLPKAKPAANTSMPGDELLDAPVSDTQKMALTKLAGMKGKKEADLIKGAGLEKNGFSDLTRNEAIQVIRHANTLPQG